MRSILVLAGLSTLALAACTRNEEVAVGAPMAGGARATAMLRTATEVAGGIRFTLDVKGLPVGTHGAHIHTTGRCDAPDFTTAGGHWNPTTAKHGSMNPQGPHEGDLPNLIVGSDGRGTLGITVPNATMAGLLDTDGAAIVVHAGADDLMTDPSGNSGGRIACGVFTAA
jgi:Cu-Zn family superoxide dismutase